MEKCGSNERCIDFVPINDGTIIGDDRYCNRSLECKQIGYRSVAVYVSTEDGIENYDLLCTGWKMEKGENDIEVL